jgi:hypothetical protein
MSVMWWILRRRSGRVQCQVVAPISSKAAEELRPVTDKGIAILVVEADGNMCLFAVGMGLQCPRHDEGSWRVVLTIS